jgi:hypothetical protein
MLERRNVDGDENMWLASGGNSTLDREGKMPIEKQNCTRITAIRS